MHHQYHTQLQFTKEMLSHTFPSLSQRWKSFLQTYAIGYPHNWNKNFNMLSDIIHCLEECRDDARALKDFKGMECFKFMYRESSQILNEIDQALCSFKIANRYPNDNKDKNSKFQAF